MRRLVSEFVAAVLCASCLAPMGPAISRAHASVLSDIQAERLDRGLVATAATSAVNQGIYLSWRLLGNEPVNNQAFDVYRNGTKIATTGRAAPTTYVDGAGTSTDTYQVVKAGESYRAGNDVRVWTNVGTGSQQNIINSYAYLDIALDRPANTTSPVVETGDGGAKTVTYQEVTYSPNDASVADLNGDGDYELIIKWDPSNSRDNNGGNVTAQAIFDAYDVDYSTGSATKMWRIAMGQNVQAGAHHSPFMVYDLNQDGKAELAIKTAPGSRDGTGAYVTAAGVTSEIRNADNSAEYAKGKTAVGDTLVTTHGNIMDGPEYLTLFNGETGAAITTIDFWPQRDIIADWGDNYGNRSERYLSSVAYLDGKTPTLIMHRGYYTASFAAAYQFDGTSLNRIWTHSSLSDGSSVTYADGTTKTSEKTLYGQGYHNLSVADVDNDGFDEVVYGGAVLDHDGLVLMSTGRGHGDAMHVSDFDNDGTIEVFGVHEHSPNYDVGLWRYNPATGQRADLALRELGTVDVGRGIMDNLDDEYAQTHPAASAIFWSSAEDGAFDTAGTQIGTKADTSGNFINFGIYWDGDLSRELLDGTKLMKYSVEGANRRFYFGSDSWFPGVSDNNSTKRTPCLQADILGDWREEVIFRKSDNSGVRLFMSTIPTDYRIPTLMSDHVYRLGVTWQNNGYNQPPHTGYYLGSAALAKDTAGNALTFLNPAIPTGTLSTQASSTQATSVAIAAAKDTYLTTADAAAHGQEATMVADKGSYTDYNIPGLNDKSRVAYVTFDVSSYLAAERYEIAGAKVRLHYKNTSGSSGHLYVGHATQDAYDEATFSATDVAFRNASTPFQKPFANMWLPQMDTYQPVELDVSELLAQDTDGLLSLYGFTETTRAVTLATKEAGANLAPTLVLTVRAKNANDPLNVLPAVASPRFWAEPAQPAEEADSAGYEDAGDDASADPSEDAEANPDEDAGGSVEDGSAGGSEGASGQDTEDGASQGGGGSSGQEQGQDSSQGAAEGAGGNGGQQDAQPAGNPVQAGEGVWDTSEHGIRYVRDGVPATGWFSVGADWFYADADGYLVSGWLSEGEHWYYLDGASNVGLWEDGATVMRAGTFGRMATGWRKVSGLWYYLSPRHDGTLGKMDTGWTWVDGAWYYLDGNGVMWTGWTLSDGQWYLLGFDGAMQTGWRVVDGAWYFFDAGGVMWTGWTLNDGAWYLLGADGAMRTGWQYVDGAWFFLADDGRLLTSAWTPDGSWVDENGRWVG